MHDADDLLAMPWEATRGRMGPVPASMFSPSTRVRAIARSMCGSPVFFGGGANPAPSPLAMLLHHRTASIVRMLYGR